MKTKNTQKESLENKNKKIEKAYRKVATPVKTALFGIGVTNETQDNILEFIINSIKNTNENYYIVTPNPEMIVFAQTHPDFKTILNNAKLALCDGMQLFRTAQLLGKPLKERIIGTDFMEQLCGQAIDYPITVGFLGGKERVAEKTAECLQVKYPGLRVVFAGIEWQGEGNFLKENHVDLLFIAFGFPKQEEWMASHIGKIPVRVMMGVGGAFDQIINPRLRPPKVLHILGLGWLYRLALQPWRIKRQIKLIQFLMLVANTYFKRS
ncbi:MAG TPA: WecB/TagA/CpsF family glycosyltransferase [Patescibacteria group bacterium]|nr:WecB/TagA/CpsF family glycosyltransferase [Patescibacteria group bacterium]